MLTLFQSAARSVLPSARTITTLAHLRQPQSMLVTQLPIQQRAFNLSAVLEKRRKPRPTDPQGPICGKCPRELPIKFPLCEKHVPCQPKRKPKCPSNPFPRCKPPNNCKYVDPRKVQEANEIDAAVKAQLEEEKRIRAQPGYPPKKKKKKHPNVYKRSCPKKLCPK